jgi:hypothetical protein
MDHANATKGQEGTRTRAEQRKVHSVRDWEVLRMGANLTQQQMRSCIGGQAV